MTKQALIAAMASAAGITTAAAEAALAAVAYHIGDHLAAGDRVMVPGLGILVPVLRKQRRAVHPGTGAAIIIPARQSVKFVPGANLAARLNRKPDQD